MRITRILAAATLLALPLGLPAAVAAPAAPGAAQAIAAAGAKGAPVVQVRRGFGGGGGGFRGFRGGGGGFKAFHGGGNFKAFRSGRIGSFSRGAYRARVYSGPKFAFKGGRHHYGNWKGWKGHGHRRHFRRFYGGYPAYYYSDYFYDDDYYYDDGGYVGDDAVARCAARYRSFDPASGTFLGNDGRRHLCPYLD